MLSADAPLPDWLSWLETLSPHEIDLGLERVRAVLNRLELDVADRVLLIGGTNGKGSSVVMAESLLLAAGHRVGAYTSPHLIRYNERLRIDGVEVADADIVAAFAAVDAARDGLPLTYFEFGTLAAFVQLAAAGLDVWIVEVGLGGRLDATNAIDPTAALITNVALDHCDWLGDDIETIAREKAGIMRAGVPVVFGAPDVPEAIVRHAADLGANLIVPPLRDDIPAPGIDGRIQRRNASNVLALLDAAGLAIDDAIVRTVLPSVRLAGRSHRQWVEGIEWLFDVAHNPAAAAELADTLAAARNEGRTLALLGLLGDKDGDGILDAIADEVDRWVAVGADSPRAVPADELARRVANRCDRACLIADSFDVAIEFLRREAAENDRILVTGSFFTVGPVLERIRDRFEA